MVYSKSPWKGLFVQVYKCCYPPPPHPRVNLFFCDHGVQLRPLLTFRNPAVGVPTSLAPQPPPPPPCCGCADSRLLVRSCLPQQLLWSNPLPHPKSLVLWHTLVAPQPPVKGVSHRQSGTAGRGVFCHSCAGQKGAVQLHGNTHTRQQIAPVLTSGVSQHASLLTLGQVSQSEVVALVTSSGDPHSDTIFTT